MAYEPTRQTVGFFYFSLSQNSACKWNQDKASSLHRKAIKPKIKSFKKVKNQIAEIALSHAIASGNFGWTAEKEAALQIDVARIAAEKGRTGTSFRDSQFRANVARNIRRRDLRATQSAVQK